MCIVGLPKILPFTACWAANFGIELREINFLVSVTQKSSFVGIPALSHETDDIWQRIFEELYNSRVRLFAGCYVGKT